MLIITADDYGKTKRVTDGILRCFSSKRITSASAMVFMVDSERSASSASNTSLEIGLHVNFTLPFTARNTPSKLREHQKRLASYLMRHKLSQILYNPFLTDSFNFVFLAQQEEFLRLFAKLPDYYNGHHHMHLCANMLLSNRLSKGARIRRTFTFERGEKRAINRLYRRIINLYITKRFISTDGFFSIEPIQDHRRLQNVINRAAKDDIEIEVHPENGDQIGYLLSDQFQSLIKTVQMGSFLHLSAK
jgi:predicted glycoside hydrolase/deacetylase ChbG (UPF0249 family)